jgi:hypothetical protein
LFDLLKLLDLIGDPNDSNSLAYWRTKDAKTGGKVIDRFCHELHEYATKVFHGGPPSGMDRQTMLATAQEWYLKPDQTRGKLAVYTFDLII